MRAMEIVYQDCDIIVVNKPPKLLSVPGRFEPDNLYHRMSARYPNLRIVHRLDMATSGLLIFALSHTAQRNMGKQFEQRKVYKEYMAVVHGNVTQDCGEIASPMICDWENRPIQKIDWLNGKPAHTSYQVLSRCKTNNSSRLLLKPQTGRSHQLRLHMLQLCHPILGDPFYYLDGSQQKSTRLLLHASKLALRHPITNKQLIIDSNANF